MFNKFNEKFHKSKSKMHEPLPKEFLNHETSAQMYYNEKINKPLTYSQSEAEFYLNSYRR